MIDGWIHLLQRVVGQVGLDGRKCDETLAQKCMEREREMEWNVDNEMHPKTLTVWGNTALA